MKEKQERIEEKGLWFHRVATVNTKKKTGSVKKKWQRKGYNVRSECDGKDSRSGKVFYGVYVRKKK